MNDQQKKEQYSGVRDQEIRGALDQHWAASDANDFETEHRIYYEDAVLEYPQSGERTRGRRNIQNQRASQSSKKRFVVRRIIGGGDLWITEFILTYDGKPSYTVSIMEFRDDKVARETVTPRIGSEIFPDSNGPVLRMRLKAPIGTRIEETEPMVMQALDLIRKTAGEDNIEITSDYVGVQPSSYPVNLIHLFTSGPEEALVQIQLRPGHPNDERLREDLRAAFRKEMPKLTMAFEAGDIISQVMSFGSPTPIQIDVQGVDIDQDYAYLAKVEAELHKLDFLRDISTVQPHLYPTVEVTVNRDYAGQFGLTMADVTNSLTPATGSSRFTAPNYWRDPKTGNAFQIQVQLPSNRMQDLGVLSTLPLMRDGQTQPQLDQVAKLEYGTMPEMIERLSGQWIVSVTANLHGMPLGEAQKRIEAPCDRAVRWNDYRPIRQSGNAH
jgi:multidrug efflux pump subunit AcrB